MTQDSQATVKIRWIRSGIAFNRNQKRIIQSLGLRRLHQVVERRDNATVRGLIAKVPHLVEVVESTSKLAGLSGPEYVIVPAPPISANSPVPVTEEPAATGASEPPLWQEDSGDEPEDLSISSGAE